MQDNERTVHDNIYANSFITNYTTGYLMKDEYCYETAIHCQKCNNHMYVCTDIVLTSNPPKYRVYCKECGNVIYVNTDEITFHTPADKEDKTDKLIAQLEKVCFRLDDIINKMEQALNNIEKSE